ncbi:MAG: 50S ribosomal protein L6 [Armatimonadetes bacterium]|nr:50S ribosomal protein L6 [Armatimonadota bacterium]
MSRIGRQPITLPEGVKATIREDEVVVEGSLGKITVPLPAEITVQENDGSLTLSPTRETKRTRALWGLTRSLLANAVEGVTQGFIRRLIIEGIGYRANLEGETLILLLGFSHPVRVEAPEGITFAVEKNTISVSGIDKQLVGNTAATIRAFRKPEPYKGKGIRWEDEVVRRKAGKRAATTA